MAARNEVAEVFVRVIADSRQAMQSIAKTADALKAQARQQNALANAAEKSAKELEKAANRQNKALDDTLKKTKEQLKAKVKEADFYKKEEQRLKRSADLREKEANAIHKNVRAFEKERNRVSALQRDYQDFIHRSHRESTRFFDKLSRQDFTRSFIENFRRGMQKGKVITAKYHQDENYLQGLARSLGVAATALDRVKSYAERAAEAFYRVQIIGMSLQGGLALIGGVIGDLIGGILSLVAVIGQLGVASVAVAGAFASMMVGMIGAKVAMGGVGRAVGNLWNGQQQYNRSLVQAKIAMKNLRLEALEAALAEEGAAIALTKARMQFFAVQDLPQNNLVYREASLNLKQAELAVLRAKQHTQDVKTQIKQGGQLAVVQANGPFRGLTKTQIAFTKWLVTLKPQVMALKEVAAQSFLPAFQNAIQTIVTHGFPLFEKGLRNVNQSMGIAVNSFADVFKDKSFQKGFLQFTKDSKPVIENFGKASADALSGIINLLNAAAPLIKTFSGWVAKTAEHFKNWSAEGLKSGKLEKQFKTAGEVASKVGGIFKTLFGGLLNIMKAAFPENKKGGGWVLLEWLQKVSDNFKNWTGSPKFGKWLENSTTNLTETIDTLGAFGKVFIELAGNPDLKTFWVKIRKAAPDFIHIFTEGAKAGPAMADLFNNFIKFISVLADSGAIKAFFTGMGQVFGVLAKVVEKLAPLINYLATFHGWILALWAASLLFRAALKVMFGYGEKILRVFGGGQAFITRFISSGTAAIRMQNIALGRNLTFLEKAKTRLQTLFNVNPIQRGIKADKNFTALRAQGLALYGLNEKTLRSTGKAGAAQRTAFRQLESELLNARKAGVFAVGKFVAGYEAGASGLRQLNYGAYVLYRLTSGIKNFTMNIANGIFIAFKSIANGIKTIFGSILPRLSSVLSKILSPLTIRLTKGLAQIRVLETAASQVFKKEVRLNALLKGRIVLQSLFNRSMFDTERIGNRNFQTLSKSLSAMRSMGLITAKQQKAALSEMSSRRDMFYYRKSSLGSGLGVSVRMFRFLTENPIGRFVVSAARAFDTIKTKVVSTFKSVASTISNFFIVKGRALLSSIILGYTKALDGLTNFKNIVKSKINSAIVVVRDGLRRLALSFKVVGLKTLLAGINTYVAALEGLIRFRDAFKQKINLVIATIKSGLSRLTNAFVTKTAPVALHLLKYAAVIETMIRGIALGFKLLYLNLKMDAFRLAGVLLKAVAPIATGLAYAYGFIQGAFRVLVVKIKEGFNKAILAVKAGLMRLSDAFRTARLKAILAVINGYVAILEKLISFRDRLKSIFNSTISSVKSFMRRLSTAFMMRATPAIAKAAEKIAPVAQAVQQTAVKTKDALVKASAPVREGIRRFENAFKMVGQKAFTAALNGYLSAIRGLSQIGQFFSTKLAPIINIIKAGFAKLTAINLKPHNFIAPFISASLVLKAIPIVERSFNNLVSKIKQIISRAANAIKTAMLNLRASFYLKIFAPVALAILKALAPIELALRRLPYRLKIIALKIKLAMVEVARAFAIKGINLLLRGLEGFVSIVKALQNFGNKVKAKIIEIANTVKNGMIRIAANLYLKAVPGMLAVLKFLAPIEVGIRQFILRMRILGIKAGLTVRLAMLEIAKAFVITAGVKAIRALEAFSAIIREIRSFRYLAKAALSSAATTVKNGMIRIAASLYLKAVPSMLATLKFLGPIEVGIRRFIARVQILGIKANLTVRLAMLEIAKAFVIGAGLATVRALEAFSRLVREIRNFRYLLKAAILNVATTIKNGMIRVVASLYLKAVPGMLAALKFLAPIELALRQLPTRIKILALKASLAIRVAMLKIAYAFTVGSIYIKAAIKIAAGTFKAINNAFIIPAIDGIKKGLQKLMNVGRRYALPFQIIAASIAYGIKGISKLLLKDAMTVFNAVSSRVVAVYMRALSGLMRVRDYARTVGALVSASVRLAFLQIKKAFVLAKGAIILSGLNAYIKSLEGLIKFRDAFKQRISSVVSTVRSGITTLSSAIRSGFNRLRNFFAGKNFWSLNTALWTGIDKFQKAFDARFKILANKFKVGIMGVVTSVKTSLKSLGSTILSSVRATSQYIKTAANTLQTALSNFASALMAKGAKARNFVSNAYSSGIQKLAPMAQRVSLSFKNLGNTLRKALPTRPSISPATTLVKVGDGLKKITSNTKVAQSAMTKLRNVMSSAFGPGSKISSGFAMLGANVDKLGAKLKLLGGVFTRSFTATKKFQTPAFLSGINQAVQPMLTMGQALAGRAGRVVGTLAKPLATLAKFGGKGLTRLVTTGGGLAAIAGASQAINSMDSTKSAATNIGNVAMMVGGAVTMVAPQVGVPIMVGAAIVTAIGKSMDAAAEKARQLEIKSAVITVLKQTNASSAINNLTNAGIALEKATQMVNAYSRGSSTILALKQLVGEKTGINYQFNANGFISSLVNAITADSTLVKNIAKTPALLQKYVEAGALIQAAQSTGFKTTSVDIATASANSIVQKISEALADGKTLDSYLRSQTSSTLIQGTNEEPLAVSAKQAAAYQNIITTRPDILYLANEYMRSGNSSGSQWRAYTGAMQEVADYVAKFQNPQGETAFALTNLRTGYPSPVIEDTNSRTALNTLVRSMTKLGDAITVTQGRDKKPPVIKVSGNLSRDDIAFIKKLNAAIAREWGSTT